MVALPVAEMDSAPGPKYSTMAPVPPLTVRISATFRMTSLDAVQPLSSPVRWTPISLGQRTLNGKPVMTSTASAPPTPMATMPSPPALGVWLSVPIIIPPGKAYCSSTTWWMIPEPGLPEADAVAGGDRLEEVVDLVVALDRGQQVGLGVDPGLDEVVAVDGGRDLGLVEAGGHELEEGHLGGGVLHGHPVGAEVGVGLAPLEVGRRGRRGG